MDVRAAVRRHILEKYFLGTQHHTLDDDTPLITGGVIDSVDVIGLVLFIEEEFDIELMPREVDLDRLDTLERIDQLIQSKLGAKASGGVE